MMDFNVIWPYVLSVLTLVVLPLLISGDKPTGAVVLINWLKNLLGIRGTAVYAVVLVVSLLLAVLVALVDGSIEVTGAMTPERFSIILAVIMTGSQVWYARLKQKLDDAELFIRLKADL